jgi:putative oxidoreductase
MALQGGHVMKKIEELYEMFVRAASSLASPFLLIIRLYWGWQMMQTGWGKLGDLGKVTNYFASLGIPAPALNAYFISGLEWARA